MSSFAKFFAIAALVFLSPDSFAQSATIRIRFENGKTGKPLPVKYMKVGGGGYDIHGYTVDRVEKYALVVTFKNTTSFIFNEEGYYRCDAKPQAAPATRYNLQEIVEHGVTAPNVCGQFHDQPIKGQLLIYSRHARFWEAVGNLRGLFICG